MTVRREAAIQSESSGEHYRRIDRIVLYELQESQQFFLAAILTLNRKANADRGRGVYDRSRSDHIKCAIYAKCVDNLNDL